MSFFNVALVLGPLVIAFVIVVVTKRRAASNQGKTPCPHCGSTRLKVRRQIISAPTAHHPGEAERITQCRTCLWSHTTTEQIAPKSKSTLPARKSASPALGR